jgi:uncharacterized protein YidB (DUF937 family)
MVSTAKKVLQAIKAHQVSKVISDDEVKTVDQVTTSLDNQVPQVSQEASVNKVTLVLQVSTAFPVLLDPMVNLSEVPQVMSVLKVRLVTLVKPVHKVSQVSQVNLSSWTSDTLTCT